MNILKSSFFLIPSVIIFCGVTLLYWTSIDQGFSFKDKVFYWLSYLLVMVFLQFVIYVNARRNKQIVDELDK